MVCTHGKIGKSKLLILPLLREADPDSRGTVFIYCVKINRIVVLFWIIANSNISLLYTLDVRYNEGMYWRSVETFQNTRYFRSRICSLMSYISTMQSGQKEMDNHKFMVFQYSFQATCNCRT